MRKKFNITESKYRQMTFGLGSSGVCISCRYIDEYAGCEPDAEKYECPKCGKNTLYGLEQAFLCGFLNIMSNV